MSTVVPTNASTNLSPSRRVWQAFKRQRLGYFSFILFISLYAFSLLGEVLVNDKPIVVRYQGQWYFPIVKTYSEKDFGLPLPIRADYNDPLLREQLAKPGNFALYPVHPYYYNTLAYYSTPDHHPGAPSSQNPLGTDIGGYDVAARLLYGFRTSVTFALALTTVGIVLGVVIGAVQGYFAGKVDLVAQRLIEVWAAMPELYLLIIFASMFSYSFLLLFVLLALFGWVNLSDYVRAEVLRNRQLEYVRAARALGLSGVQIIWRHILPNSLTPVITFLPFRISAAIVALASLDFLGLGVSGTSPSLGQLLLQGKENLDAWWISLSAFSALMVTMMLLTFMGDGLRQALDARAERPAELDALVPEAASNDVLVTADATPTLADKSARIAPTPPTPSLGALRPAAAQEAA
ncbi:MAG: ABC transporter permease [Rhizobacter sp.]